MYVKCKISNIKSAASLIDDKLKDYTKNINDAKVTLDGFKNFWYGEDYDNFEKKVNGLFDELKVLQERIEDYSTFLKDYTKKQTELDNAYANKNIDVK